MSVRVLRTALERIAALLVPCRARTRLQAGTVSQADRMRSEIPAAPCVACHTALLTPCTAPPNQPASPAHSYENRSRSSRSCRRTSRLTRSTSGFRMKCGSANGGRRHDCGHAMELGHAWCVSNNRNRPIFLVRSAPHRTARPGSFSLMPIAKPWSISSKRSAQRCRRDVMRFWYWIVPDGTPH